MYPFEILLHFKVFFSSGAHTIGHETDNNIMISFSNFKDDGNVETFPETGQEYHVTEDKITHKQYEDSEAQFRSLFTSGVYIDMKRFLKNEKMHITQETKKNQEKFPESKTSLFLHDLPLQGECLSYSLQQRKHMVSKNLYFIYFLTKNHFQLQSRPTSLKTWRIWWRRSTPGSSGCHWEAIAVNQTWRHCFRMSCRWRSFNSKIRHRDWTWIWYSRENKEYAFFLLTYAPAQNDYL